MDYALLALIISIFASRFIQLNAFKNLADEDKGKVLSKNIMRLSQVSTLFTAVLIIIFFVLVNKLPDNSITITSSFFSALILQRIIVYFFTRKRLLDNGAPSTYINKYFLSWLVATVGVSLFIILFIQQYNHALGK